MAKTPGFTEYVDDRDSTIVAQLRDNDPRDSWAPDVYGLDLEGGE